MRKVITAMAFRKDVKRMRKRGKALEKLEDLVTRLVTGIELEPKHKPHPLTGNWKPLWDAHIEPDWLLIYEITETEVYLARTGSHADLFG